jgi:hypothetical protein
VEQSAWQQHRRPHEEEGCVDEGWYDDGIGQHSKGQHGGMMAARSGMAAGGTTETTTARGSMTRGHRKGTAWQQGAGQLSQWWHRRWHKENGGGIAHGRLCWLREWDQRGD